VTAPLGLLAPAALRTAGTSTDKEAGAVGPRLDDLQTVRGVGRLFRRVSRHAGARLADQKVAEVRRTGASGARLLSDPADRAERALAPITALAIKLLVAPDPDGRGGGVAVAWPRPLGDLEPVAGRGHCRASRGE
jgi:hypothetical protein